jgi:hypothetical protein
MAKGQTTERWGDETAEEGHKTIKGTETTENTTAKDLKERETGPKTKNTGVQNRPKHSSSYQSKQPHHWKVA